MTAVDDWIEAAGEQRLLVQRCRSCGQHQHYPRALCTACHGIDLEMVEASGRGVVHSFTVIHRAPRPDIEVPYVVAIVELEEGVRMLSHVVDCGVDEVRCDQPVSVRWRPGTDGRTLPVFAPRP